MFKALSQGLFRGAFLYVAFYGYIFVLVPLTVAFDQWAVIPIWGWMGIYSLGVFLVELYLAWPDERLEPVMLVGPSLCAQSMGPRNVHFSRSRIGLTRPVVGIVASVHSPLHRRLRFGRTRIR